MDKVQCISLEATQVLRFEEENISGSILHESAYSSVTAGYIDPGKSQTAHFHHRPDHGEEIIFVYDGRFKVRTETGLSAELDAAEHRGVLIVVPSGKEASLVNVGTRTVSFFSVFSPPFKPGEIHFLADKQPL